MFFYKLFQIIFYLPIRLLFPTRVYGRKNIIKKGGAVFVCNHQSNADVLVLGTTIWRMQHFLAKKELFQKPFLGLFLKSIQCIPINREKPELSSIKKSLKLLENNKVLTIFPQGTRKDSNKMDNVKDGVIMFAVKSKKPILPIWIEKKPGIFRFNKMFIGKPIYLNQLYDKKYTQEELEEAENNILLAYQELSNEK